MDEVTAEQLGSQDRLTGKNNAPLANSTMMAEFQNAAVGEKTHLLAAYNRGWQREITALPRSNGDRAGLS